MTMKTATAILLRRGVSRPAVTTSPSRIRTANYGFGNSRSWRVPTASSRRTLTTSTSTTTTTTTPHDKEYDQEIQDIVDYALTYEPTSNLAYQTAHAGLLDTIGCGLEALEYSECTKLLPPLGASSPSTSPTSTTGGARVPGTSLQLDNVVQGAFSIGTAIRWLDFNDTWLAAEWGHPSDNLGAILAVTDWCNRNHGKDPPRKKQFTVHDILTAMIQAHEIQGCLALENSLNNVGLDHVMLVKIASTAVTAKLLGLTRSQALAAVSLALVDGQSLRTYRHAPNTGSRKSWAAGDATSRAVWLALVAQTGEMGYPTALTAPKWGFYDVSFGGKAFQFQRPYASYVMENVLFKISFPAEFHAQTAVEAAMKLREWMLANHKTVDQIQRVAIRTHEACIHIIDKQGPLHNPADRDHCIQYMVAIPLLFGQLTARDYSEERAADPHIDMLRTKIVCVEDPQFTADYHDPDQRSIANAMTIEFNDGTHSPEMVVEYPVGHKRRREEGWPLLMQKYKTNLARIFDSEQCARIEAATLDYDDRLLQMPADDFMSLFVKKTA